MNIGMQLRQAREARGLSVGAVAATTRIQPRVIDGIERNDLSAIPPRPFARGFVATYAREVGLDPAETVRTYFAQFTPPAAAEPSSSPTRSHPAPSVRSGRRIALALVAGAAVVVAVAAGMSRSGARATAEAGAVGTSGQAGSPAAAPAALDGQRSDVALAAARAQAGLVVVLEVERAAWITAGVDGTRVLYRTLPAGARETLRADRMVTVRAGDAGAVRVSVDGGTPAPLGRPGEVRTVVFTAGGR